MGEESTPNGEWAIEGRLGNYGIPLEDGLAMEIPEGYMGILATRSGMGARGIRVAAGMNIIDSDYRGEGEWRSSRDGDYGHFHIGKSANTQWRRMEKMQELLKCPYCNGMAIIKIETICKRYVNKEARDDIVGGLYYYAECDTCLSRTVACGTEEIAASRWNMRGGRPKEGVAAILEALETHIENYNDDYEEA